MPLDKPAISPLFEMCVSLEEAMEQAGGKPGLFFLKELSAFELLELLAPNDIRFVYRPKRVHRKKV